MQLSFEISRFPEQLVCNQQRESRLHTEVVNNRFDCLVKTQHAIHSPCLMHKVLHTLLMSSNR